MKYLQNNLVNSYSDEKMFDKWYVQFDYTYDKISFYAVFSI